jgi:CHAT domain-containing protein
MELLPRRLTAQASHLTIGRLLLVSVAFLLPCGMTPLAGQYNCGPPAEVEARADRLRAQWTAASLREAIKAYATAESCWRKAGQPSKQALALIKAGEIHLILGEYTESQHHFNKALRISRTSGVRQIEAEALSNLTLTLTCLGKIDQALIVAREAVSVSRESGDVRARALALTNSGILDYMRGEWRGATEFYKQALPLSVAAGDAICRAQLLLHIGYLYGDTGDLEKALDHYKQALPLWRAASHRGGEANTLTSTGLAYAILGDMQKAIECLNEQALPLLRTTGDKSGEAAAHNNLGFVYQKLGEYEQSLAHYRLALSVYGQIRNVAGEALTVQYVGNIYELLGKRQEAMACYEQGLKWSRAVQNILIEADALNRIGSLHQFSGKRPVAHEYYKQALAAYRNAESHRGQAATLTNIGNHLNSLGEWQKALEHYQDALALFRLVGDRSGEASALYGIARIRRDRGDFDGARAAIETALTTSEALRLNVSSQEMRASYFASVHQQFELYVDVLMGRGDSIDCGEAALEASERGKARSLLEAIAEAQADIRSGVNSELLQQERSLQRQISAKAEQRIKLAIGKATAEELSEVERELGKLTAKYSEVQGQVRALSPRFDGLTRPIPLKLKEIQEKVLDTDTVLLEYALGEQRSFVWAVTPFSIKSFVLPPREEIELLARLVYSHLTARNRLVKNETWEQTQTRIRREDLEYAKASAALGQMLLEPVADELGNKRIVVVADGALQYLPFAALPAPRGQKSGAMGQESQSNSSIRESVAQNPGSGIPTSDPAPPMIAEHEVVSLPSASALALMREELRGRRPAPKSVAILADPVFDSNDERLRLMAAGMRSQAPTTARRGAPAGGKRKMIGIGKAQRILRDFDGLVDGERIPRLPFSQREAEAIMSLIPQNDGMLALGFQANLATAMSPELSQYRIIHFATHGLLNSQHPELSGLVLSLFDENGKSRNGFLQLHEIYNLNLPADLVVLSACQTALGKEVRGEGIIGLTRGFMYAGAARVIASLWKVDDAATAELMQEFYKMMLNEGLRPAAALRAAQVRMWRQRRWSAPYYWAAFTLQGEWR